MYWLLVSRAKDISSYCPPRWFSFRSIVLSESLYNDIKIYGKKHWPTQSSTLTILASGTRFYTFLLLRGSFSLEIWRLWLRSKCDIVNQLENLNWLLWISWSFVKSLFSSKKFALVRLRIPWKNESHRNIIFNLGYVVPITLKLN